MIELRNVSKRFPGAAAPAVEGVSLRIGRGETVVLLGSSGSGKSTLLRMVNGLVRPDAGTVLIHGKPLEEQDPVRLRRTMGYVIQQAGLFPHWTVAENVGAVPRLKGAKAAERRRIAEETLAKVRLDPGEFLDRFPDELSGGQQQRVGVARALAANPDCLLMDEPFGALDGVTREALQDLVKELRATLSATILFVTHDLFEALSLADRIAVLHEGRLEQAGTAREMIRAPATAFVRELFAKPARQFENYREHGG
jgi:osmoprotectant transport system ATP-binding protein